MATFGVEFVIGVPATVENTEDKVDQLYISLAECMAVESVDVAWDEEKGSLAVLLGITAPDELNPETLAVDFATDAITKAMVDSGLSEPHPDRHPVPSARVLEFA